MKTIIILSLFSLSVYSLEVVRFYSNKPIHLKFIRANIGTFGTWTLTNSQGVEMELVCRRNKYFGNTPYAFLEYKNFYRQKVANFKLEDNRVCLDIYKYLESVYGLIREEAPFYFKLDRKKKRVSRIEYPIIDEFAPDGYIEDLMPVKKAFIRFRSRNSKNHTKRNRDLRKELD